MTQEELELKFKFNYEVVKKYVVRPNEDILLDYLTGDYNQSKTNRIAGITCEPEEILDCMLSTILVSDKIEQIQGIASKFGNMIYKGSTITNIDYRVATAMEILHRYRDTGIFKWYEHDDADNPHQSIGIKNLTVLPQELKDYLDIVQYVPPMISKPKDWTTNHNGGYYTFDDHILLGHVLNKHNKPQAVDPINILQGIKWELNEEIVKFTEVPNKPLNTIQKRDQFNLMAKTSRKVYDLMLELGNKFYFVWRYDKRGRLYSQGYHINLQSTEYKKSILQFKRKETISNDIIM